MSAECAALFMADLRTFDLGVLAQSSGVAITDFPISCYYCSQWLTAHEKILYQHSSLLVVWKDDLPFACCQPCIRTGAKVDFLIGFTRTVGVSNLTEVTSAPWESVLVRCLCCLRMLTTTEKEDLLRSNKSLYLVKDSIRVPCALCRLGL